jgi:hypothetical protein
LVPGACGDIIGLHDREHGQRQEIAPAEERQLAGLLINASCQPVPWPDYRDDTAGSRRFGTVEEVFG